MTKNISRHYECDIVIFEKKPRRTKKKGSGISVYGADSEQLPPNVVKLGQKAASPDELPEGPVSLADPVLLLNEGTDEVLNPPVLAVVAPEEELLDDVAAYACPYIPAKPATVTANAATMTSLVTFSILT